MTNGYYVYALLSKKDHRIYVGMSYQPQIRLIEHNSGNVRSTKPYRPWIIIHCKYIGSRKSARLEERKLKSGSGKEFLKRKYIPE